MKKIWITMIQVTALTVTAGYADVLANFDFENHTAGAALGGPVGTARVNTGTEFGDGFDFNSNSSVANSTASVLAAVDASGTDDFNRTGANVRSDTVAATVPGGNFLEISPHRVADQSYGDIQPGGSVDYFAFSVQADSGYALSLSSFSFDLGVARGASDTGAITFRGQGWYSLDDGTSWTKMRNIASVNNTAAESFAGFTTIAADLTGFGDLQNQAGEVLIALSLSDNSARTLYSESTINPAGYYLDNIQLEGSVIPEPAAIGMIGIGGAVVFFLRRSRIVR